eukprot:CAMPEP_0194582530 /NCGR_PEP_ID=MMETSP0292-20121207/15680_1 /TAXON_ID=39354 /ORGANISM="Heterosigma akashiwo, Strain CCMP2393" /LENGTH=355 /DNA_ID=CAMNT_0039436741 /DNA_START=127 /DNA_END=1195 /DNA_ORIENTATION=+
MGPHATVPPTPFGTGDDVVPNDGSDLHIPTTEVRETSLYEWMFVGLMFITVGGLLLSYCCIHYVRTLKDAQEQKRSTVQQAWAEFKKKKQDTARGGRRRVSEGSDGRANSMSQASAWSKAEEGRGGGTLLPRTIREEGSGEEEGEEGAAAGAAFSDGGSSEGGEEEDVAAMARGFVEVLRKGVALGLVQEGKTTPVRLTLKGGALRWAKARPGGGGKAASKLASALGAPRPTALRLEDLAEVAAVHGDPNRFEVAAGGASPGGRKRYAFAASSPIERNALVQGLELLAADPRLAAPPPPPNDGSDLHIPTTEVRETSLYEWMFVGLMFITVGGLLLSYCCIHYVRTLKDAQEQKV